MKEIVRIIESELEKLGRPLLITMDDQPALRGRVVLTAHSNQRFAQCYNDSFDDSGEIIVVVLQLIMDDVRSARYNPAHPNFDPTHIATMIHEFLGGSNDEYDQMR